MFLSDVESLKGFDKMSLAMIVDNLSEKKAEHVAMNHSEHLRTFWRYIHNYQILNFIQKARLDECAFHQIKERIKGARASIEYADWNILDYVKRGLQQQCKCLNNKPEYDDSALHKPFQKLRTLVNQSNNYQNYKRILKRRLLCSDRQGVMDLAKALKEKLLGVQKSARVENLLISGPVGGCGKTATLRHLLQIFPLYDVQVFMTSNSPFPFDGILSHKYACLLAILY